MYSLFIYNIEKLVYHIFKVEKFPLKKLSIEKLLNHMAWSLIHPVFVKIIYHKVKVLIHPMYIKNVELLIYHIYQVVIHPVVYKLYITTNLTDILGIDSTRVLNNKEQMFYQKA